MYSVARKSWVSHVVKKKRKKKRERGEGDRPKYARRSPRAEIMLRLFVVDEREKEGGRIGGGHRLAS